MTVEQQIEQWAEANYENSHSAQCVVEGCYDAGELEEDYDSLQAFIDMAAIVDDVRQDVVDSAS